MCGGAGLAEACGNGGLRKHPDDGKIMDGEKDVRTDGNSCLGPRTVTCPSGKTKDPKDKITASEESAGLVSGWNFAFGDQ